MTYIDIFFKGGIMMWPILLCSLLAVVVIIERWLILSKAEVDPRALLMKIRSALSRADAVAAVNACSETRGTIPVVLRRALGSYPEGPKAVREMLEAAGKEEVFRLEHRLGILANLAGVSPMLGFLGTVVGMITAFHTIELLGGNVNSGNLAGGVWEAMLSSAFGLAVGIPSLAFYNYFVGRVSRITFALETTADEFMGIVKESPGTAPQRAEEGRPARPMRTVFDEGDEYFEPKND